MVHNISYSFRYTLLIDDLFFYYGRFRPGSTRRRSKGSIKEKNGDIDIGRIFVNFQGYAKIGRFIETYFAMGKTADLKRRKISATIITLNEETLLGACLESVTWADEIIVVDSGSSDRTVEIARKYTDKVLRHDWPGYSAQKNWAVEQASHDWVLSLDADERITPALQAEMIGILEQASPSPGYYIARKNFFLGKWIRYGGWYPDHTLRLFDRKKGKFADRMVHEAVEIDGTPGFLQNPMEHYTYRTLNDYHERAGRYTTLAALEMHRSGRPFRSIDLLVRPFLTFFKMYLLRQGFREGLNGFLLSALYGYYVFLKYAKLWELESTAKKKGIL